MAIYILKYAKVSRLGERVSFPGQWTYVFWNMQKFQGLALPTNILLAQKCTKKNSRTSRFDCFSLGLMQYVCNMADSKYSVRMLLKETCKKSQWTCCKLQSCTSPNNMFKMCMPLLQLGLRDWVCYLVGLVEESMLYCCSRYFEEDLGDQIYIHVQFMSNWNSCLKMGSMWLINT